MREDITLNSPESLKACEERAKKQKPLEKDDIDKDLMKDIADFDRHPLEYLKRIYSKGEDLKFRQSKAKFLELILLAKIAAKK